MGYHINLVLTIERMKHRENGKCGIFIYIHIYVKEIYVHLSYIYLYIPRVFIYVLFASGSSTQYLELVCTFVGIPRDKVNNFRPSFIASSSLCLSSTHSFSLYLTPDWSLLPEIKFKKKKSLITSSQKQKLTITNICIDILNW